MFSLLEAKVTAAGLLCGGSLFAGLLPKWLGFAERIEHSLLLSVILCFGAGVLLATSILHILHDTVAVIPKWGEIFFCAGFMALYFVDEFIQFCFLVSVDVEKLQTSHHHSTEQSEEDPLLKHDDVHSKYGSFRKGLSADKNPTISRLPSSKCYLDLEKSEEQAECYKVDKLSSPDTQGQNAIDFKSSESVKLTDSSENSKNSVVKKIGLVFALCVHSILEGLAVGTQPSPSKVLVLLVAVGCHKLVITFCLGAELASDGSSYTSVIGSLGIYAFCSGAGVLISIVLKSTNTAIVPLLQGLAGGSLLYITVGEILPRERFHKSHCIMPKPTGLYQFLSVLAGIMPIAIMNVFLDNDNF